MIGVDRIEAWRGKQVLDPDDEDLGKLDDVLFDSASGTPLLISVKSGLLGRHTTLVPIDGARVGPDYVRVAHRRQAVEAAGHGEGVPDQEGLAAVGSAYGLRFSERIELESGAARDAREAEAEAARQRAEQLEAEAQEKIAAHEAARDQVQSAGESAGQAQREAEQARQAALEARREADRYGTA
jgi:hypothetical protein